MGDWSAGHSLITVCGRQYRKAPITRDDPWLEHAVGDASGSCGVDVNELGADVPCVLEDEHCEYDETLGLYHTTVEMPSQFLGILIGKSGKNLKQMMQDTGSTIEIPSKSQQKSGQLCKISIKGESAAAVNSARTRVELISEEGREKADHTHFINVPLVSRELCSRVQSFYSSVVAECGDSEGFDPSILVAPNRYT